MELTPLGVPVEFDFDMNAFGSAIETKPENILSSKGKVLRISIMAISCVAYSSIAPHFMAPSFIAKLFRR